ncbi:hypothetical protein MVEN_02048400 [Mycena venus]|uniref:Uncharacterized protein n=1 Tax=Mycena venus TaxID=2733690 RepID=A0A8H7CJG9_9AGAR|nr:hypothetical protein MVEN_02048400 [Mycena venus]
MALPHWTRTGHIGGRVYTRALGLNELGFYYDSHINGTADTLTHNTIQVSAEGQRCFAPDNIVRAWCALKTQFPLLAAAVQMHHSHQHFVVAEERLRSIVPNELSVSSVSSLEEAQAAAIDGRDGERKLSDNLLCRIVILSRTDDSSTYHVLINVAHLIVDGVGTIVLLRAFLDMLSSSPDGNPGPDLEARLSLAVAAESLVPTLNMSVARQRWRRAAGHIISQIQDAKRTGGQTLPRFFGPIATRLPARSGLLSILLSPAESLRITQNLRKNHITMGNSLPVLAQVSLSRLLCRRYVRNEISTEEWQFRKKEPYHTAGPINLRPFLDKTWYDGGGHSNVSVNIGYFYFTLGFTPLGPANLAPGDSVPEFSELMSPKRFLLRCNQMKTLASRYLKHPLFFEIGAARLAGKIEMQKTVAAKWGNNSKSFVRSGEVEENNVSPAEQAERGAVHAHGWSTYGGMGGPLPREYPSQNAGSSNPPLLRLQSSQQLLHCRTGELYLGAGGSSEQLSLVLYWDKNVYSPEIVQEWVDETARAMNYYLGSGEALAKL